MDLGDFYLGTPLDRLEYVGIKLSTIPQEFINEYNLLRLYTTDGCSLNAPKECTD